MRKRRSLENGKFYKNSSTMQAGAKLSKVHKKIATPERMKAMSQHSKTPEALEKKSRAIKLYFKNNPNEFSRRITEAYKKDPELRVKRGNVLRISRTDMENYYTDAKNAEERRTHKDGKQVIRFVEGVRTSSTGVLIKEEE